MIKISTVYIDVLFFVNLSINISLIMCTGYIIKLKPKTARLIISASFGALYSCFIFIGDIDALYSLGMRAGVAVFMMLTAFGRCTVISLIKRVMVFLASTLALGILMLSVLYFSDIGLRLGGVIKNGVFYFNIPTHYMLLCSLAVYGIIYVAERLIKRSSVRSFARVTLRHLGKTVELKALVDTGNMLRDPLSGRKVLIAEANKLSPLFDFDIEDAFREQNVPENMPAGFRLIPYSSIGNQNGLMAAFIPDTVKVESIEKDDIITAVFCGNLSQSGDYNALISPETKSERMEDCD